MTVRINKQKINLREKLAGAEDKVNFDEVVRGLGEYGGNVGIGTTSPDSALHISSNSAVLKLTNQNTTLSSMWYADTGDGSIFFIADSTGGGTDPFISFRTGSTAVADERLRLMNNGNVGIGTTNPNGKLNIAGVTADTSAFMISRVEDATIPLFNIFQDSSWQSGGEGQGDGIAHINTNNRNLAITTSSGASSLAGGIFIRETGNVGIGTTTPSAKLEIEKNSYGSLTAGQGHIVLDTLGAAREKDEGPFINFRVPTTSSTSEDMANIGAVCSDDTPSSRKADLVFWTRNNTFSEKMRITSGGNVGIGTTNPGKQLTIYNSIASAKQFQVESDHASSGWGGLSSFVQINGALSRSISVGAYRPDENVNPCGLMQLQSRDGGTAFLWLDDSNVLRLGTNSGNVGSTSGTSLGTAGTSDERLKNIEDVFEYGLSHVLQLKPIAFTFKKDAQQVRKLGFGAQTSQSVVPESVYDSGNCIDGYDSHPEHEGMNVSKSDDNELGMEYVQLIPVLTKAIQEQQSIIEDLKSRIETLEQQ